MAFAEEDFSPPGFQDRGPRPEVDFVGLTRYYDEFDNYVIPPMSMDGILGEVLARNGLRQLRVSETQKFRHVTSFFNSKLEEPFPGEERILVDSPKVPEAEKPEMSAFKVAEIAAIAIGEGRARAREAAAAGDRVTLYEAPSLKVPPQGAEDTFDVVVVNFVNGDMVGHTGDFDAAVKAIEAVDDCVGRVVRAVKERGGAALVTSDHGNAEQMVDTATGDTQTAHTINDVDLIYVGPGSDSLRLRPRGILSDIAPTVLTLLGVDPPPEMTARSLIETAPSSQS
jgi:2,3-bisphosphoglycerate-independent phosphoglycerate mutase